jgi:hypothetical protein
VRNDVIGERLVADRLRKHGRDREIVRRLRYFERDVGLRSVDRVQRGEPAGRVRWVPFARPGLGIVLQELESERIAAWREQPDLEGPCARTSISSVMCWMRSSRRRQSPLRSSMILIMAGARPVHPILGPQRKAALRFIFTKSLFARLQTQPFFFRLKSCGSAAGPI